MNNRIWFKILSVCASTLICLFLIEGFLYIQNYSKNYKKFPVKIFERNFTVNSNIDNLRNKKDLNLFIGDSFTKGEVCAGSKKDLVSQFNKLQNSYYQNLGIQNGNPIRYIELLNNFKLNQISRVVLVLYYNDINLDKSACYFYKKQKNKINFYPKSCDKILKTDVDSSNDSIFKKIDNFLENKLRLWLLIREGLVNVPYLKKFYNRSSWRPYFSAEDSEQNKAILHDIKYLKEKFENTSIKFYVTYYPDVNYLKSDNPTAKSWRDFTNIAKNIYGIKIYDPWSYFLENKNKNNMSWSLIDNHPNCDAHLIMAKYLKEKVLID